MSLASVGYREVQAIVQSWTKKYQYHISLLDSKPNQVRFMVEFSLPQPLKPVPPATIRVYFACANHEHLKISFRFEKDSLIHSPSKTIRQQEIEKWIDDSLAKKLLVRETVFYLGTAYDSSRIHDARQDAILRETPKKEEAEFVYISPELLSDQKRLIEVMERPHLDRKSVEAQLKRHFQAVDKENIGVITHPEFLLLLKNVGVRLNPLEEKELLRRVDPQESGMVERQLYSEAVGELVEGLESKKEADAKLAIDYEEEVFGSILALINDESQDIQELMLQKFKAKDEDETGLTNISEVKTVFDEINKKYKEDKKTELLTVVELADITKLLTDLYGYKQIPYPHIHRHIIDYKVKELATGRLNSRVNNLEVHLQQLFSKFDEKKNGKIKVEHFEQALKKSEKMQLTKAHLYLLKSLILIDTRGEISYTDNSKFLAELIKRFYLNSTKKRD